MLNINKIKGAIFGLAVGDAMGATTEFMKPMEITSKHGYLTEIIGGGWLDLKKGEVTDDTEMMLCVARGILKNPEDPRFHIGEEFLKWFKSDPKDIGVVTNTAILNYQTFNSWYIASQKTYNSLGGKSAGNGSLMRCLPVAIAYTDKSKIDLVTKHQSELTHYDQLAIEACLINNSIANYIIYNSSLKFAIEETIKNNKTYAEVLKHKPDCDPDGFVVNTLKWVLRVLYTSNTYTEVIERLVNEGGDSDTTAAIAGGLAGLYWGYDAIPQKHIDSILIKDELENISNQLYQLRKSL